MEDNEDEPDDVKKARPVEEEIRRGEIDESSGRPVKPHEGRERVRHRCEKYAGKKTKGKAVKPEGDECCRAKKAKAAKVPKTATVLVYEKECTLPKIKAIPRHCLTKEEWIDILATPSRKCPSPCLRKEVTKKLRPVSTRMAELAQPPKNRLLNTLESRAGTLPTELVDNLIQSLEGETCLTPEQAEKMFRDKDNRAKNKCRKKKSKIKCGSEKVENSVTAGINSNVLPLDKEAVNCQYIMAEGFVRSILDWKCPIPREEFKDIAGVILKRLGFILEYNVVNGEDKKSQQMRFLADIIGSWISGVLFEVAETQREQLEEECEKRLKEKEEETEDDSEDETEEDFDFGRKDDDDDDDDDDDEDDDEDDEKKKKDGQSPQSRGKDDQKEKKKKDEDEMDDEMKKMKEGEDILEGVDDSGEKVEEEEKKTQERSKDETRDENFDEDERRAKELDEGGKKQDGGDQGESKGEPGKIEDIVEKEKANEAEALEVTTAKDLDIEKQNGDESLRKIDAEKKDAKDDEEKGELDQTKSLGDTEKIIDKDANGGGDKEAKGVKTNEEGKPEGGQRVSGADGKMAGDPDQISAMAMTDRAKLGEEERPEIGQRVSGADGKMAADPDQISAMAATDRAKLGEEERPEIGQRVSGADGKMADSPEETSAMAEMKKIKVAQEEIPEVDKTIASDDKMDDPLQPVRVPEGADTRKRQPEVGIDSPYAAVATDMDKLQKELKISSRDPAIQRDPSKVSKDDEESIKIAKTSKFSDEFTKLSGKPDELKISKKLSKLMGEKKYRTDTPFVTFDKIFHTIYNAIEDSDENPGTDPISNRIHRAVYEKFSNVVQEENPGPLAELTRDVIDVMSGKIALWLRKILTESQIKFINKFPASVESAEVREWTQWISNVTDTADDWSAWIRNTIKQAENMREGKITRGDYRDWTESVDTDALRWRRFHLESLHLAHQHLTMVRDRQVVKTGTRQLTDYNEDKEEHEREIKTTDLEVERRNVD